MLGLKSSYGEYIEFNTHLNRFLVGLGNEALWLKRCSIDLVTTLAARHDLCAINDSDTDETLLRLASVLKFSPEKRFPHQEDPTSTHRPHETSSPHGKATSDPQALVAHGTQRLPVYDLAQRIVQYILSQTEGPLQELLQGIVEPQEAISTIAKVFKMRKRKEIKQLFSDAVYHVNNLRIQQNKQTLALFVQRNLSRFRQLDVTLLDCCNALLGVDRIEDYEWLEEEDSVESYKSLFVDEVELQTQRTQQRRAQQSITGGVSADSQPGAVPAPSIPSHSLAPSASATSPHTQVNGQPTTTTHIIHALPDNLQTPHTAARAQPTTELTTQHTLNQTSTQAQARTKTSTVTADTRRSSAPSAPTSDPRRSSVSAGPASEPRRSSVPNGLTSDPRTSSAVTADPRRDPRPQPRIEETQPKPKACSPVSEITTTNNAQANTNKATEAHQPLPTAPATSKNTLRPDPASQHWVAEKAQNNRASQNPRADESIHMDDKMKRQVDSLRERIQGHSNSQKPFVPIVPTLPPSQNSIHNPPGTQKLVAKVKALQARQREIGKTVSAVSDPHKREALSVEYQRTIAEINAIEEYLRKVCTVGYYGRPKSSSSSSSLSPPSKPPPPPPPSKDTSLSSPAVSSSSSTLLSNSSLPKDHSPQEPPSRERSRATSISASTSPTPESNEFGMGMSIARNRNQEPDTSMEYSIAGSRGPSDTPPPPTLNHHPASVSSLVRSRENRDEGGRSPKRHQPLAPPSGVDPNIGPHNPHTDDLVWGSQTSFPSRPSEPNLLSDRFQPRPGGSNHTDEWRGYDDSYRPNGEYSNRARELASRLG